MAVIKLDAPILDGTTDKKTHMTTYEEVWCCDTIYERLM